MDRRTARLALRSLSLGLALAAFPVVAGEGAWSVTGSPSGGWVGKVVVDPATPTTLYTTSNPGVFKSTDSGATWTLVFASMNAPADLVLDPQHPATLYLASDRAGALGSIFKSTDGGASWAESDTGLDTIEGDTEVDFVGGLAVDPVDAGVVYATSMNTGVYKSTDGGGHWSHIDTGLSTLLSNRPNDFLNAITVDPNNPLVLYLPTQVTGSNGGSFADHAESGIYRSTDGGAHWSERLDHVGMYHVVVDPNDSQTVYAGGSSLYESTDGGASWAPVSGAPVNDVLFVDPADSQHLWGSNYSNGVYETTDGGAHWHAANIGNAIFASNIARDPITPANLYAASNWGVFKTTDGGATWAWSTEGIHDVTVDLMLEGADGITYLASGGNGIYKSPDQGASWAQVGAANGITGSLPSNGDFVYSLVEDPTANSTLYAGTTGGIFKTVDGGDHWTESDTGVPNSGYTLALAIDPENTSTLYAATNTDGAGVYKSVDGGASWTAAGNGLSYDPTEGGFQALAVDPHHSDVVYAGSFFSGLFKSTDGGASWQPDNGAIGTTDIWSVAVDPDDSNVVYTATSNGFFKSTDAGATWVESDWGLCGNFLMTDIQFDPADSDILYVTQRYGIGDAFVSPDAGYTWYDMSTLTPQCVDGAQQAKPMRHKAARGTLSLQPGHHERAPQSMGRGLSIRAAAIGAGHTRFLGGASDGQVYTFDVRNLPKPPAHSPSGSGGSGGTGSGATSGSSSGGGGGSFSLLMLGLLGFGALRRKR